MIPAADHPGAIGAAERGDPGVGVGEQGAPGDQLQELLGLVGAGERPEAGPAAAGQEHRVRTHDASTGADASSINWRRIRAVAPQTVAPPTVYHVSS